MSDSAGLVLHLATGESSVANELFPLVYEELKQLAERSLRGERPDHTLQPTALVHEAYLRLVQSDGIDFRSRAEFIALAAHQIRRILIDHARRRQAGKRGGGWRRQPLVDEAANGNDSEIDLVALDESLTALARRSSRQSRIVELRFFGGLTIDETAQFLDVSSATVKNEWRVARAWLSREIQRPVT